MQQRLAQFIRESVNDENVNILPDEPRNFNFKFTHNSGPTSLNRQLQLDDTIKEKQNRENEYINFSIDRIEQQQMRKHGMSRLRQKRLNYTNKINALRLTNAKYNERINILQPTGQETALPRQRSDIGVPLKQIEMEVDKSEINKLLKLLGDNEDEVLKLLENNKDKPTIKTQEMKQIVDKLKRNEPKSEEAVQDNADQLAIEFQEQLEEKYSGGGQGTYMPIGQVEEAGVGAGAGAGEGVEEQPLFTELSEQEAKEEAKVGAEEEAEEIDTGAIDDRNNRLKVVIKKLKNIGSDIRKPRGDSVEHYKNLAMTIKNKGVDIEQFEMDFRSYVNSIGYKKKETRERTIEKLDNYS